MEISDGVENKRGVMEVIKEEMKVVRLLKCEMAAMIWIIVLMAEKRRKIMQMATMKKVMVWVCRMMMWETVKKTASGICTAKSTR